MDDYLNPWVWLLLAAYFTGLSLTLRWGARVRDAQRSR